VPHDVETTAVVSVARTQKSLTALKAYTVAIAFFDLDKTLLSVNSGSLWVRREFRMGHISAAQAARAALWLTRYHLGYADAESMVAQAVAELAGKLAAPIEQRTADFFSESVRHTYRAEGLRALAEHRAAGDALVLLTSSSNYLSAHVRAELKLDGVLCNTLGVDTQGRLTGSVVGRICFGRGKLEHAQREAASRGTTLDKCSFYTDSFSDLPVLEAVGRPVAVCPDPRLRRHAQRCGWPIAAWR
jgi:HAD superfamily hydrolase (TIGR01490 family)